LTCQRQTELQAIIMGSYVFRWPYDATEEVFVTGTFDDWGKTVRLEQTDHGFEKEVSLPFSKEKIYYKFVVDNSWTIDPKAPYENDGNNNTNNVLLPEKVRPPQKPDGTDTAAIAVMAGVTPDSSTVALAAKVPKEPQDPGVTLLSSAAPDSTTADLAKDVPLEPGKDVPGTFPGTPAKEPDQLSVNPIPATNGIGNPIHLAPGEKVPDPSEITSNTIQSTVTTDEEGYNRDASNPVVTGLGQAATEPFDLPPVSTTMIPESSLPMYPPNMDTTDPGVTIQSVAPNATTVALAASVPLEPRKLTNGAAPAGEVPDVVKQSIAEAREAPEATANAEAVEEKKEVEDELLNKVVPGESTEPAVSASEVPPVVRDSLAEAHQDPEAAANPEAVEEKREVEEELQQKIKPVEYSGEPAPTITTATVETAPVPMNPADSTDISPKTRTPVPSSTLPTGISDAQTAEAATSKKDTTAPEADTSTAGSSKKKRHRISILLHRLKEKLKEL